MIEIISSVMSKGQGTIPSQVRYHLEIDTSDRIAYLVENDTVQLRPDA